MIHLTMNSGHARVSPRSEVADHVIAALRPFVVAGCEQARLLPGRRRLFWSADDIWPDFERLYLDVGDIPALLPLNRALPSRPLSVPWCAAVLVYPLADPEVLLQLGDLERCLAWAFLATQTPETPR